MMLLKISTRVLKFRLNRSEANTRVTDHHDCFLNDQIKICSSESLAYITSHRHGLSRMKPIFFCADTY